MSDVIIRDKSEYHARTSEQMERHLAVPAWSRLGGKGQLPTKETRISFGPSFSVSGK